MDGLEIVKICTGYRYKGEVVELPPYGADAVERCEPVYEEMPGWQESTEGIRGYGKLPGNARAYLDRISSLLDVDIDIISTSPERDDTIILRHPFTH
jgi:adenylosuccinate synthase